MRFGWVRLSVQAKEGADAPDRLEMNRANPRERALDRSRRAPPCLAWEQGGAKGIGDVGSAVAAGLVTKEQVTPLGKVLTGEADGRRSAEDITVFDSTGLALQDLAIAIAAYAKRDEPDLPTIQL